MSRAILIPGPIPRYATVGARTTEPRITAPANGATLDAVRTTVTGWPVLPGYTFGIHAGRTLDANDLHDSGPLRPATAFAFDARSDGGDVFVRLAYSDDGGATVRHTRVRYTGHTIAQPVGRFPVVFTGQGFQGWSKPGNGSAVDLPHGMRARGVAGPNRGINYTKLPIEQRPGYRGGAAALVLLYAYDGGTWRLYDSETLNEIANLPFQEARLSQRVLGRVYGMPFGTSRIQRWDWNGGSPTITDVFDLGVGDGSFGRGEGSLTVNDSHVVVSAGGTNYVVDLQAPAIVSQRSDSQILNDAQALIGNLNRYNGGTTDVNNVGVSPLGGHVVAHLTQYGFVRYRRDGFDQPVVLGSRDAGGTWRKVPAEHDAMGLGPNGEELLARVHYNDRGVFWDLAQPERAMEFDGTGVDGGHISMNATDRPGWALFTGLNGNQALMNCFLDPSVYTGTAVRQGQEQYVGSPLLPPSPTPRELWGWVDWKRNYPATFGNPGTSGERAYFQHGGSEADLRTVRFERP